MYTINNNVFFSLLVSLLAGVSTFLGGLVVFLRFKDKDKFICFCLSFSLSVMISISVFELIPDSTLVLYNNFGIFWTFIIGSVMFLLGKTLVTKINKKITLLSSNDLYRVGVLSMIALMVHNFPEGIATFMLVITI